MNVQLETARLLMRPVTMDDRHDFFELDSDPEVHRYLGNKPITKLSQAEAGIQYILKQYDENKIGRLAIIEKESGAFVGWSGLKYETVLRPEFGYYDLGYRLKRKFWGRGFATESAHASLLYGFDDLNLEKICAAADVDNIVSNRILGKTLNMNFLDTFTYEGTLCNWYELPQSQWRER